MIYFLKDRKIPDVDLGILDAGAEIVRMVRSLCRGPMPPGVPSVLALLAQLAGEDPEVFSIFAGLKPVVMDVIAEGDEASVRMTVVRGKVRVFSGIRFERVRRGRGPDITVRASAPELARVISGAAVMAPLVISGAAPELIEAVEQAGRLVTLNPERRSLLLAAAGGG
jgi:hypothetical protein